MPRLKRRGIARKHSNHLDRRHMQYLQLGWSLPALEQTFEQLPIELQAAAWEQHRAEIMADHLHDWPCTRPHGWWMFDSPAPPQSVDPSRQPWQLDRLDVLSSTEIAARWRIDQADRDCWGWPVRGWLYRRPWAWWQKESPQPRRQDITEQDQLRTMRGCLSDFEISLLDQ